jgi:hypothetical protein
MQKRRFREVRVAARGIAHAIEGFEALLRVCRRNTLFLGEVSGVQTRGDFSRGIHSVAYLFYHVAGRVPGKRAARGGREASFNIRRGCLALPRARRKGWEEPFFRPLREWPRRSPEIAPQAPRFAILC